MSWYIKYNCIACVLLSLEPLQVSKVIFIQAMDELEKRILGRELRRKHQLDWV